MYVLFVEYIASQRNYELLNDILCNESVAKERPFEVPVEARLTIAALEHALEQNKAILTEDLFSKESSNCESQEKQHKGKKSKRKNHRKVEFVEEEEEDSSTSQSSQTQSSQESEDLASLKKIQSFWTSVTKPLYDLECIHPINHDLVSTLKLIQLFVQLKITLPSMKNYNPDTAKTLVDCVCEIFDHKTSADTGFDDADLVINVLLNRDSSAEDIRSSCESLLRLARGFTFSAAFVLIREYLDEAWEKLRKPVLLCVEDDIKKGLYDPAAVKKLPSDPVCAIEALQASRSSLAKVVKDPLPDALGMQQPEPQQQQQQIQKGKKRTSRDTSDESSERRTVEIDEDLKSFVDTTEPPPNTKVRKLKRPFSKEETEYVERGVARFGVGNWVLIRDNYPFHDRSAVDIKDKWRNLQRHRVRVQKLTIEHIAANGLPDVLDDK